MCTPIRSRSACVNFEEHSVPAEAVWKLPAHEYGEALGWKPFIGSMNSSSGRLAASRRLNLI